MDNEVSHEKIPSVEHPPAPSESLFKAYFASNAIWPQDFQGILYMFGTELFEEAQQDPHVLTNFFKSEFSKAQVDTLKAAMSNMHASQDIPIVAQGHNHTVISPHTRMVPDERFHQLWNNNKVLQVMGALRFLGEYEALDYMGRYFPQTRGGASILDLKAPQEAVQEITRRLETHDPALYAYIHLLSTGKEVLSSEKGVALAKQYRNLHSLKGEQVNRHRMDGESRESAISTMREKQDEKKRHLAALVCKNLPTEKMEAVRSFYRTLLAIDHIPRLP